MTAAAQGTSDRQPRRRPTARERARTEVTAEILEAARRQLADSGAGAISLRAIARDLGMSSSAVYRYFPSRDDVLTRLIVEAYDAVGEAAEGARDAAEAAELSAPDTFREVWRAVRAWALAHPHEYALIYGSPVPGYRAPVDTVPPATRLPWVLLGLLASSGAGAAMPPSQGQASAATLAAALGPLREQLPDDSIDDQTLLAALTSYSALVGALSFELFGHTHNVVESDPTARASFFDDQIDLMIAMVGIPNPPQPPR